MEVDEKPTEHYNDIGGLVKQIEELVEAIVLPMTHAERFKNLGIKPPKGVLMYGPPGTGKTLLARACAAQTNATYLKLAATSLVQMFIGDGAKMVRDAFELAKAKKPTIIFIDELDAIGTKRFDSDKTGDREVQRTMLELLNQLDGFSSDDGIKVRGFFWEHILLMCCRFSRATGVLTVQCTYFVSCAVYRSSQQQIVLIFWTQPCFVLDDWIVRSSSLLPMKKPVPRSCESTAEK
jgi:SpoVK/Ycf46/Vps4 family AAA+-type ATPase